MTPLQTVLAILFAGLVLHILVNMIRINKITLKYRSKGMDRIWSTMPPDERFKVKRLRNYILLGLLTFIAGIIIVIVLHQKGVV